MTSSWPRKPDDAKSLALVDSTTLMTFIFRSTPEVRTVELLGSWDNFDQPYQMHHDRRRGTGFWSGCFKFENIVFDGHGVQRTKPRRGGLMQGGTYWYYYRLNYAFDTFDERQPHTTKCPFVPGQAVNVVDVPCELAAPPLRSQSACGDILGTLAPRLAQQQTLEPNDKFAMLEPPRLSKLHSRCVSDEALDGRLEGQRQPSVLVEDTISPLSTPNSSRIPPQYVIGKTDRHLERKDHSRASSVYSQRSVSSWLPAIAPEIGKIADDCAVRSNPAVLSPSPYSSDPGPAPLGSFEALGAAIFAAIEDPPTAPAPATVQSDQGLPLVEASTPSNSRSKIRVGARSVHNVHSSGSRPGTNLTQDPDEYRPRMYSLPNIAIKDCFHDRMPPLPGTATSLYSPWESHEVDESSTPNSEISTFGDLISPTSSEATMSTPGQSTPLGILPHNSFNQIPPRLPHDTAGGGFKCDVRVDGSGAEHASNLALRISRPGERYDYTRATKLDPHPFQNYSLPNMASDSSHSLAKTITPDSRSPRPQEASLPAIMGGEGRSMAEDIFSELGF